MEILTTADHAESLSASFVTRILALEDQVGTREAEVLANAAKYGQLPGDQDRNARQVVKIATRNAAKREARQYRRDLAGNTEAERTERLKQLRAIEARANSLAPLFETPVQMLSRAGLGSAERTHYHEQLRDAGPRELKNYADWALHKGDRILAAAVLSRLDKLSTESRPFKAMDFARTLVGDEFDKTRQAIERIRVATQRALNANRDFETGRIDATARISMGLARRPV